MKVTITVDSERTPAGDVVVRGIDSDSGRVEICLANARHENAIDGARVHVHDQLYLRARGDLLKRLGAVRDEIVEAARDWYSSGALPANSCALGQALKKLRAVERDFV